MSSEAFAVDVDAAGWNRRDHRSIGWSNPKLLLAKYQENSRRISRRVCLGESQIFEPYCLQVQAAASSFPPEVLKTTGYGTV